MEDVIYSAPNRSTRPGEGHQHANTRFSDRPHATKQADERAAQNSLRPSQQYFKRSGSSKPKKKASAQPIKIIKNINNNNYIFNNPQIQFNNNVISGGDAANVYPGGASSLKSGGPRDSGGITVIKENNVVFEGTQAHMARKNPEYSQEPALFDQLKPVKVQRMKGTSPKLNMQDSKAKKIGQAYSSTSEVGSFGKFNPNDFSSGYQVRKAQSSKGMTRPKHNNLVNGGTEGV